MHKVVIERPRWNPGPDKNGRRANLPDDLLPKLEGIKRPHMHRKAFTDLLGPLRRWLRAQLGRPWSDVYSEACAVIKPDSVVRAHVKTHLLEFVERHTFMHEGKVCVVAHYWHDKGVKPIEEARYGRFLFYVHPETLLLCGLPPRPRPRWRSRNAERRAATQRWINKSIVLRQLNGYWFECRVEVFPREFTKGDDPWRYDFAEKKMIGRADAERLYGRYVYCTAKRQLSRRELRRFNLGNSRQIERSLQPTEFGWVRTALDFIF